MRKRNAPRSLETAFTLFNLSSGFKEKWTSSIQTALATLWALDSWSPVSIMMRSLAFSLKVYITSQTPERGSSSKWKRVTWKKTSWYEYHALDISLLLIEGTLYTPKACWSDSDRELLRNLRAGLIRWYHSQICVLVFASTWNQHSGRTMCTTWYSHWNNLLAGECRLNLWPNKARLWSFWWRSSLRSASLEEKKVQRF